MDTSTSSRSTNRYVYSNATQSVRMTMSKSKQTFATINTRTTGVSRRSKLSSGRIDPIQTDEDFEDINEFPKNRIIFLVSVIFPFVGYYGLFALTTNNRRERLWAIAMVAYAILMTLIFAAFIAIFVSLY
ncbi:hypothetical protein EIN_173570 [Entamoeba invadens IP1]|uniref:Uncharacterized protein n=1 Tax=Entamoeba invadens IP1 TaxID=370355 RepID=A0A0A1TW03_ENTIV|nr:hypothetical protein EIN_173570 [Entamoeba invadens IP1]ELP84682.1 hypothetical protein EIN_173570 [Entamoeba invadens IP1]|eukprot:XP_004184028.1 hypothetical protein EIN_173570 [Entamoeba invadens IP1]